MKMGGNTYFTVVLNIAYPQMINRLRISRLLIITGREGLTPGQNFGLLIFNWISAGIANAGQR